MIIDKTSVSVGEFFAARLYRINTDQAQCDLEFASQTIGTLVENFLELFRIHSDPKWMSNMKPFYLGSVATTHRMWKEAPILEGADLVITLMLLLIYLQRHQPEHPERANLEGTVYIRRFGRTRMNPTLEGGELALEALFDRQAFDFENLPPAALDITKLFFKIEESFPAGIEPEVLPCFTDWLLHCVTLDHTRAVTADGARILEMAQLGKVVTDSLQRCRI